MCCSHVLFGSPLPHSQTASPSLNHTRVDPVWLWLPEQFLQLFLVRSETTPVADGEAAAAAEQQQEVAGGVTHGPAFQDGRGDPEPGGRRRDERRRAGGRGRRRRWGGDHRQDGQGQAPLPHLHAPLEASHLPVCGGACGFCRDQLSGEGRCFVCGHAGGTYSHRNTPVEDVVRAARIQCPYEVYGCRSYVTYYHVAEHQRSCPHAPCLCSEPGCGGFAGTPAALRDHLRDAHSWPVDAIRYGAALQLRVPEGDRLLLVAADGEGNDGAVFLLAVGAFGDAPLRVVSLVCARPDAAAAVGPRYACWMRAVGPGDVGMGRAAAELAVPSSAAPGEASLEEAATMVVLRGMMHGATEEKELQISIHINRIV